MSCIESLGFDKNRSIRDIFYCFNNANTRADYNVGKDNYEMFIDNPHFYLNPSDNVKEAIKNGVKDGDKVLTVAGSGDYMLDCILKGATKIVNYDINSIQYYVLCLKIWAMKVLDYEDYLDFFTVLNNKYLDFKVFNRILKEFKDEAAYPFWEYFMKARRIEKNATNELKANPFFGASLLVSKISLKASNEIINHAIVTEIGPSFMPNKFRAMRLVQCYTAEKDSLNYLSSEQNYKLVKSRLDSVDISFIESNVVDLCDILDEKFDVIFLSNIPFYLATSTIVDLISNKLMKLVVDGGRICAYHQGMRLSWFKNVVYDSKFRISKKEFNMGCEEIQLSIAGVQNILLAHKELARRRYKFTLREIPTYGGAPEMRPETDVVAYIKRRY